MFLITFGVLLAVMGAVAVGVMFGKSPIKGSCGGLNNALDGDSDCPVCGNQQNCLTENTKAPPHKTQTSGSTDHVIVG
jgi:hypothetical protein